MEKQSGKSMFKDIKAKICFRTTKRKIYPLWKFTYWNCNWETVNVEFVSNVFSVNNNKIIQCIVREKLADKKTGTGLNGQSGCPLPSAFESKEEGVLFIDADAGNRY
jgi:hypothetical protein